ncbi:hypothetical protein AVEN_39658-1, partial [Araneus ventricosus]
RADIIPYPVLGIESFVAAGFPRKENIPRQIPFLGITSFEERASQLSSPKPVLREQRKFRPMQSR